MEEKVLINKYDILKRTFSKALDYLEYEDIPMNKHSLNGIILELDDKKDMVVGLSMKEKNALFLIDFYEIFLEHFYPRIKEIVSKNETDMILSPSLIPEVRELNAKFKIVIDVVLKKYGLTKSTLLIDEPFLAELSDFKSLFIGRKKPYPDFDYNVNSWEEKRQKIERKVRITELFAITRFGENYRDFMNAFEASFIKTKLENLIPVYDELLMLGYEGTVKQK